MYGICLDTCNALSSDSRSPYNERVARFLMMIWAHESAAGRYRRQSRYTLATEAGAWGPFQMEQAAVTRCCELLNRSPVIADRANQFLRSREDYVFDSLDWGSGRDAGLETIPPSHMLRMILMHDATAAIIARLYLLFDPQPIPADGFDQANYAKRYWNTYKGSATPAKYLDAYTVHVLPALAKMG